MIAELINLAKEYKIVSSYIVTLVARFFSITYRLVKIVVILLISYLTFKQPNSITTLISFSDNIIMLSFAIIIVLKISFFRNLAFTISILLAYFFLSVVLLYSALLGNLTYFIIILILFSLYFDFITFSVNQLDNELTKLENQHKVNYYYINKQKALLSYYENQDKVDEETIEKFKAKNSILENDIKSTSEKIPLLKETHSFISSIFKL